MPSSSELASTSEKHGQHNNYGKQERKLTSFHMCCHRRILGIHWGDKVPNSLVLARTGLPTTHHVYVVTQTTQAALAQPCATDGGWPHTLGYFVQRTCLRQRTVGRPQSRFQDVWKRDMKALETNTESWEDAAANRSRWRSVLRKQRKFGERKERQAVDVHPQSHPDLSQV